MARSIKFARFDLELARAAADVYRRCRAFGLALLAMLVFSPISTQLAHADATQAKARDAETLAAARSLAVDGVKLARAGYCAQAIDRLERAEALHHSAIVLAELGECYLRIGKVVAASEALRSVAHEALPELPSASQLAARGRADVLLMQATPQIAQLTLDVSGPKPAQVEVTIDDQPVSHALLGVQRPTDPGHHYIEASAAGFVSDSVEIDLSAGDAQVLTLSLHPLPTNAQVAAPSSQRVATLDAQPTTALASKQGNDRERAPAQLRAAYSLLAIGAAGITAGIGFGAAAWRLKTQLDESCAGDTCPASERDELDAAKRWGLSSTISFSLGGVSAALGALLVVLDRRDRRSAGPRRWSVMGGPGVGLAAAARF